MDFQKLDGLLNRFAERSVPGCACVIVKDGEPIYEGYAGYADVEARKPVYEHSIFRQASTTKLFTYVLLMQLFEQVEERLRQIVYDRRGCHYGWILFEQLFEREKTTLFQHQPVGIGFRGGIMTVFLFQF